MNTARRIAVYWSPGRSLEGALAAVARLEPDARICAVVPQDYVLTDTERGLVHEVIHADGGRYSLRRPRALLTWVARLRREHFDQITVLFDSPRLMVLAAAAGPRAVCYLRPNGTAGRLPKSVCRALATLLGNRVKGYCAYAVLCLLTRVTRVGKRAVCRKT